LAVVSGRADDSLHITQTTAALRIGVLAIFLSPGALGLDVCRDAGRSGFPDHPLNRRHGVLETIADLSLGFGALPENRHAHVRATSPVARGRLEIRHIVGRRDAKQETVQ
jgi:hypothetical protein